MEGRGFFTVGRLHVVPMITVPFFQPGQLNYRGDFLALRSQFEMLSTEQKSTIRWITMAIPGIQMQQENVCCKVTTLVVGIVCIIPFCVMCCNCYKVDTEPLFNMNDIDYMGIAQIIRECRSLKTIKLYVQDNFITPAKTKIIEDALQGISLTTFTFENCVMGLNITNEYDDFDALFAALKENKTVPALFCGPINSL
jgi:hypothetical protein